MPNRCHIAWWVSMLVFSLATAFVDASTTSTRLDAHQLNILFISSFKKNIPAQAAFESGLDQALGFKKGKHNLYFEFMDIPRLNEGYIREILAEYLAKKYRGIEFDFLVGWAAAASNFLSASVRLFPDARRVHVGTGASADPEKGHDTNEIFIGVEQNYSAAIREVIRLERPSQIYVIGTSSDFSARARLKSFRSELASIDLADVKIEYLIDKTLDQVASRLASAPARETAAFYLLMFSDGAGINLAPYDVIQIIAPRSAVPIYSFWESLMGSGIAGGYVLSIEQIGINLGKSLLSIHAGETVRPMSPMRHAYDWQALQRWRIPPDRLPVEAVIINRPTDLLTQYRWHILSAAMTIVALSVISLLLFRALKLRNMAVDNLDHERRNLSKTVDRRTRELQATNKSLILEVDARRQSEAEKKRIIANLENALHEIKTLEGILPLCSFCKKIRNDKGYWEQVDIYIHKYSDADISHSVCPDCMEEHYLE